VECSALTQYKLTPALQARSAPDPMRGARSNEHCKTHQAHLELEVQVSAETRYMAHNQTCSVADPGRERCKLSNGTCGGLLDVTTTTATQRTTGWRRTSWRSTTWHFKITSETRWEEQYQGPLARTQIASNQKQFHKHPRS